MHGNTPYAGQPDAGDATLSDEQRRSLQRDLSTVAARTRSLLPDGYTVGSEIRAGADGPTGTVAVRPPVGAVVRTGFAPDADDPDSLAHELAAGAALEVKRRFGAVTPPAR